MPKIEDCKEQEEKYFNGDAIKFTHLGVDNVGFICRTGNNAYMLMHASNMDRWSNRCVYSKEGFITETQLKHLLSSANGFILWARSEDVRISKEC